MSGHDDPIMSRLSKLAESGATGVLRVPGEFGGAVYLREGDVIYATSKRTPGPVVTPSSSFLERSVAVREATLDAVADMLSGGSRHSPRLRFYSSVDPGIDLADDLRVEMLASEVARRRAIMEQLPTRLTADSGVRRSSNLPSRIRISARQWSLLIRVGSESTPRGLAAELGRSVFATTLEVSQLVALRLLDVTDPATKAADRIPGRMPGQLPAAACFLRSVT